MRTAFLASFLRDVKKLGDARVTFFLDLFLDVGDRNALLAGI